MFTVQLEAIIQSYILINIQSHLVVGLMKSSDGDSARR